MAVPTFVLVEGEDGKLRLLNLEQITVIDQIDLTEATSHCRILFANSLSVEVHGDVALRFFARIAESSEQIDGTPLTDYLHKLRRKAGKVTTISKEELPPEAG
jgi:hypothetical protein